MNWLDYLVLFGTLLSITGYGIWQTRHRDELKSYLKGEKQTPWFSIGLSVMATQASAITFLSTPGQGYMSGLGFVQIYFGVPIALILISIFFLPSFNRLNIYTAYELLEKRFDGKTRLLGAGLFLLQRGFGAGLTVYAPAIVLSTVFGWPLPLTIISCGLLVIIYTVLGGSDAVTLTQKYQFAVIFAGMLTAALLLIAKLPSSLTVVDTMKLAGGFQKLNAVSFSTNLSERYTLWSGLLGGTFLMLSYFGTDQSQVQRYICGTSLRESRLGLLFNAICKIPMQFFVLLLGVLLFVFYQFHQPPLLFDAAATHYLQQHATDPKMTAYQADFQASHSRVREQLDKWLQARHSGDESQANAALASAYAAQQQGERIRAAASKELSTQDSDVRANNADYVFITFILNELPHGAIGLLITAFFAATLSSKAAELNALGATTTIDLFRRIKPAATDAECLRVTRWSTALWGLFAIGFALVVRLAENLIQAVNIVGSIFYGVLLGLFVVAFFVKRVGGTATFWSALAAQALVLILYFNLSISYLWYPLIGCSACIVFSIVLQLALGKKETVKEFAS